MKLSQINHITYKSLSSAKYLEWVFNPLEDVYHFNHSNIRLLAGKDNIVAEAPSQLEIHDTVDLESMAAVQKNDIELHNMHSSH